MTRARAKATQDKVNSLLSTLTLDTPMDGMLLTADTLCIIRCEGLEDPPRSSRQKDEEEEGGEQKNRAEAAPTGTTAHLAGTTA